MTPFEKVLVALMFALIQRETPGFRKDPDSEKAVAYKEDIAKMVKIDGQVTAAGHLVSPDVDRVILGGIRFYEGRFRSSPQDGDCRYVYPKLSWEKRRDLARGQPNGMLPAWAVKPKRVCPATGPMQISKGNRFIAPAWPEVRTMFSGIKEWDQLVAQGENVWKVGYQDKMTVQELRDPTLNVRFGYGLLWHWKVESNKKLPKHETRTTPPGTWITAWGWGKLSPINPRTVRYVDMEGKRRCELITKLLEDLEEESKKPGSGFTFAKPAGWYCGHEKTKAP